MPVERARHLRWDPLAAAMRDMHWSLDAIDAAIERAAILQEAGMGADAACDAALAEVGTWPEHRRQHRPRAAAAPASVAA